MVKKVQSLSGKLAALSRFLSRSAERTLSFFKTLKEEILAGGKIEWTETTEEAFVSPKKHLQDLPALTTLMPRETLYLYLAATEDTLSGMLIKEENSVQRPIYFMNKLVQGAEKRYLGAEKLFLALVHASRQLKHYFQAYPISVLTN